MANPVKIAVERAGGAPRVSRLCGCSRQAVHYWIAARAVKTTTHALKLSALSGVPVWQLAGLSGPID